MEVVDTIKLSNPDWNLDGFICQADLANFRSKRVRDMLEKERGELTVLEDEVVASLHLHDTLVNNIEEKIESDLTFGESMADNVASFGGSWKFIFLFSFIIVFWILFNLYSAFNTPFDPYPFILLNLVLSCLAAMQAPIIMMSQNRQASKDRSRAIHDYQINLKSELEIRHLHEKMDHLLSQQWERLVEIQQLQLELLTDLTNKKR